MDESLSTDISTTTLAASIVGECTLCGKCCSPPVMCHPRLLTGYTPVIGRLPYDGHCKYLAEVDKDGNRRCILFEAELNGELGDYPQDDVAYWKGRCKPWPHYDGVVRPETLLKWVNLGFFEGCGYVVSVVVK